MAVLVHVNHASRTGRDRRSFVIRGDLASEELQMRAGETVRSRIPSEKAELEPKTHQEDNRPMKHFMATGLVWYLDSPPAQDRRA
jgi:hypothetical protein